MDHFQQLLPPPMSTHTTHKPLDQSFLGDGGGGGGLVCPGKLLISGFGRGGGCCTGFVGFSDKTIESLIFLIHLNFI